MGKPNPKRDSKAINLADRFLWLAILAPVLAVSAWSLFTVARYLGVPEQVAWAFSACFDGAALLAANYALKYAQVGLSGSFPRTVVRLWAGLAAFVQTLHAHLGGEPPAAALVWASLPITAVVIYEIHTRWVRREALARAGTIYPAALPGFGALTWVMFPWKTWFSMRTIVGKRKDAIVLAVSQRPAVMAIDTPKAAANEKSNANEPKAMPNPKGAANSPNVSSITDARDVRAVRAWAKDQGLPISDRARIAGWIYDRYDEAHRAEASGE